MQQPSPILYVIYESVYEADFVEVTWFCFRSLVCITDSDAEAEFISLRESELLTANAEEAYLEALEAQKEQESLQESMEYDGADELEEFEG